MRKYLLHLPRSVCQSVIFSSEVYFSEVCFSKVHFSQRVFFEVYLATRIFYKRVPKNAILEGFYYESSMILYKVEVGSAMYKEGFRWTESINIHGKTGISQCMVLDYIPTISLGAVHILRQSNRRVPPPPPSGIVSIYRNPSHPSPQVIICGQP